MNFKPAILALAIALSPLALPTAMSAHGAVAADFSPLVERVSSGVVRVSITKKISEAELARMREAQILQQLFGNQFELPDMPTVERGYGTGFFVSADGYILTNHHVVEDADSITITLQDRTELDARLIGSDEASDVAVLKVTGKGFPALKVAKGDTLKVGEPVLAIGSPFGFDYSASSGIVSAKSRNVTREAVVPFIQTDVALNQGNSGGPLFNQKGEVVGINSFIFSRTGGHMGLSFSIPIDTAMDIYEQIRTTGKVSRVYLGVALQDIDRNLAEAYHLDRPQGALITRVSPDSPAKAIGLKTGDVVLNFNGQNIVQASDLLNLINRAKAGDKFSLSYLRAGKRHTASGQFAQVDDLSMTESKTGQGVRLGLRLQELSAQENRILQTFGIKGGVLVSAIDITGLAGQAGLVAGDIIISLNHIPTTSTKSFERAMTSLPQKGVVTIGLIRDGVPVIIGLRIE